MPSATPDAAHPDSASPWLRLRYALLAALLALLWQFLTVTFNYHGNWTALFCTGAQAEVPPALAPGTYRFPTRGYDGQFYRYLAHDPFLRGGYSRFMDDARRRYRRILLPATAWLLAAGQPGLIDSGYFAAVLLSVALGVWFLSRCALYHRRHPAWGLTFLFLPSTLIALDRMTVDVALLTCCAAFAYYLRQDSRARLWLTLALAVLVHETGAMLVAAACFHQLWQRRLRRAALLATALLPALLWYRFLDVFFQVHGLPVARNFFPIWMFQYPIVGILIRIFRPETYPLDPARLLLVRCLDALALAGVLAAVGFAVWRLVRRHFDPEAFAAVAFAGLLCMVSNPDFWHDIHGWGRTVSPLLFFLALPALTGGPLRLVLPLVLVDLRLAIPFASQALSIFRAIF